MDQRSKTKKNILIACSVLFILLILIDRYYWAQISQWREDQATNIWLGYTSGIRYAPVGLISSSTIPNPNGMVLLGFFLSALPNLLSVSFFLGFVQIFLLLWLGWRSFGKHWHYFLLVAVPPLTSIILRSISVEFWNQYIITLLNIFFIFWALRYLEKPSLWNLPPIISLILLAPSLYLAGIVNAIAMALITTGMIIYRRPNMRHFGAVVIIILLLIGLSVSLTWFPYFQNVSLQQIASYSKANLVTAPQALYKHSDVRILSTYTQFLLKVVSKVYLLQVVFAFIAFFYLVAATRFNGSSSKNFSLTFDPSVTRIVILSGSLISLAYLTNILLGGPNWLKGERLDQTTQFLPMFLFFIFLLPWSIARNARIEPVTRVLSYLLLAIFMTTNLIGGFMIIRDHLQYRGNILTEADVPLITKMQVVDFIATDWNNLSDSKVIPVDYDLDGGIWNWVPTSGMTLTKWYPAPMTIGRSFDYELLRRYGLTNQQEGVQFRAFGNGRYLITYAFERRPKVKAAKMNEYIFGRLRVTVVENSE